MDYFEFYGLPVSFNPDAAEVKKQFYALSKKYHPDFYINESAEKQDEVLELSTLNNKAYQVLNDPQKVLPYVLELKGLVTEGEHYTLPQDFLMEMMDVNEALMDLQFDPDAEKLALQVAEINRIEKGMQADLDLLKQSYNTSGEADDLVKIKDLYYRTKYLYRIRESLAKIKS
ncbi:MAG: Fe-S protein assembly co-chaperone HscB [Pedobacter sp.]|nr:MAG: Fe-S protein assembly co-chaperone HscB [Pedobacter sp.]